MTPILYTFAEAAARLNINEQWLRRRNKNHLPHVKLGLQVRFTEDHLAEIIRIYEQRPTTPTKADAKPITRPRARKTA